MSHVASDSELIRKIYSLFEQVRDGENIPDFYCCIHPDAQIVFSNETYTCDECISLMNDFCRQARSMKVTIVGDIECLNEEDRTYLVLSDWEIESMRGGKGMCPFIETINIKDEKIHRARGVISMGGELSDFLSSDVSLEHQSP